jgi:hypothetical protein
MFPECFKEMTSSDLWAVPRHTGRGRALSRGEHWPRDRAPPGRKPAGLDPFGLWSLGRCQRSSELTIQISSPGHNDSWSKSSTTLLLQFLCLV